MRLRYLLLAAATAVAMPAGGALAADMPEGPPPQVIYAPENSGTCGARHVDHVWRPGQVAYIAAGSCDAAPVVVTKRWLDRFGMPIFRENVLVYYNGGSWNRPDVRVISPPYQPQLH